jgi:hypothetical protein
VIARSVTREQLEQAAAEVGVRLVTGDRYPNHGPAERPTKRGLEYRFNLATDSARFGIAKDGKGGAPYRRMSDRPPHRTLPGRVCWCGHRDYLRALYRLAPGAYVRTAMATYKNAADFERHFPETYHKQAPYMGFHLTAPADQVCTCQGGVHAQANAR